MNKSMTISVLGCGRWGSFIGWYLDKIGNRVTFYGQSGSASYNELVTTRTNGVLSYRDEISFTQSLEDALKSEVIVISIPSQSLRSLMGEISLYSPKNKIFILCMKGLEIGTGKRLSEVAEEFLSEDNKVAVWIGPGHPQEFAKGVPNCMVIDCKDKATTVLLADRFSSPLIRFYYGTDLIGNEIGAALKNVIGIGAGFLDGLGTPSLKGALISRATSEVSRFIGAMGGNPISAYGLCHLGDYEATVFSKYSQNRAFGEAFIKGEKYSSLAEGYYTADAVHRIALEKSLDLPITSAIYFILYENADITTTLEGLFSRAKKSEF